MQITLLPEPNRLKLSALSALSVRFEIRAPVARRLWQVVRSGRPGGQPSPDELTNLPAPRSTVGRPPAVAAVIRGGPMIRRSDLETNHHLLQQKGTHIGYGRLRQ